MQRRLDSTTLTVDQTTAPLGYEDQARVVRAEMRPRARSARSDYASSTYRTGGRMRDW